MLGRRTEPAVPKDNTRAQDILGLTLDGNRRAAMELAEGLSTKELDRIEKGLFEMKQIIEVAQGRAEVIQDGHRGRW